MSDIQKKKDSDAGQDAGGKPAPKGSPKAIAMGIAAKRHAIPFFIWIGVMLAVQLFHLSDDPSSEHSLGLITRAEGYAIRVFLCAIALLLLRPWSYYGPLKRAHVWPAVGIGAVVFIYWVGFESEAFKAMCPPLARLYETWCVMPFGAMRAPLEDAPYAPQVCGLALAATRFIGSAFVIAIAEEFFWRGFLYRWAQSLDFLDIDIGKFSFVHFWLIAAIFGFEHGEWLAGVATGALFCWFLIKTRDIWAVCIAHIVANFLLATYAYSCGQWQFL